MILDYVLSRFLKINIKISQLFLNKYNLFHTYSCTVYSFSLTAFLMSNNGKQVPSCLHKSIIVSNQAIYRKTYCFGLNSRLVLLLLLKYTRNAYFSFSFVFSFSWKEKKCISRKRQQNVTH